MVLNHIFSRRTDKGGIEYFAPDEVEVVSDTEGKIKSAKLKGDGGAVDYDGIGTMSKSKRNGVDPNDMIERYGADTARFYVMQANPPTDTVLWSDESVEGSFKFLRRLWTMVHDHVQAGVVPRYSSGELDSTLKELRFKLHKAIEKVGDDYGRRMQFNTAIAAIREMLNLYTDLKDRSPVARAVAQEVLEDAVLLLSPVIPHITTVLWSELRPGTRLLDQPWPSVDANALVQDSVEIVVQVNGRLRGRVQVPSDATQELVQQIVLANETIQKFITGAIKKFIYVPGKLANVVV
jgi:leucyl-tRNA synthetase